MEEQRRILEKRMRRIRRRRTLQEDIEKILGIAPRWWGDEDMLLSIDSDEDSEDEAPSDSMLVSPFGPAPPCRVSQNELQTPPPDFSSMLVFSPVSLPDIFQSLITDFRPALRNAEPANALYMLTRFACLNCDHNWIEDLIIGATDAIEDVFFVSSLGMSMISSKFDYAQSHSEDPTYLIFWLYNTTVWLHLMRCDNAINNTCEALGSLSLVEEILNSVFGMLHVTPLSSIDTR